MNEKSRSGAKPNAGWFRKGQSGNPNGRPIASRPSQTSAFDIVMEKTLTVAHQGGTREITLEEALQQRTFQDALAGKRMAQREVLKSIQKREAWLAKHAPKTSWPPIKRLISPDPDNADAALLLLGIAAQNPSRMDIDANRRRGGSRMTGEDHAAIRRCTRDPDSLSWPRGTDE